MSEHQPHASDRMAAFRGLILGPIVLGLLLVTIVRLTNAHYAAPEGAKAVSASSLSGARGVLDA